MTINASPQDTLLLGVANADGTFTGVTATQSSKPLAAVAHDLLAIAIIGNGVIAAGTVLIEEAFYLDPQLPYSGTWSLLATINAATLTGGAQTIQHFASGNGWGYIRVRITVAITGGGGISAISRFQ